MTERKWTKGPWEVLGSKIVKGPIGNTVADCRYKNGKNDANLIAAAPELYEALESALNFISNTESEIGYTLASGELARAALAKARGETQ